MAADKAALMLPPPPRLKPLTALHMPGDEGIAKVVLPEEDYTEGLAAIIERDYFPDIPKLRSQLEWAQAIKSGDPALIRQAQINIARRRAGLLTPALHAGGSATPGLTPGRRSGALHAAATPGGWGVTPAAVPMHTPSMTPLVGAAGSATPSLHGAAATDHAATAATGEECELKAPPMSLDTFVATHTSEDNASFARIQAKDVVRKRRRVAHHLEDKNQPLLLEGPEANPTDGFGTGSQQPMTLVHHKHTPTNALYYVPDQKALSVKEANDIGVRPAKAINIKGTRLKAHEPDAPPAPAAASAAADAAGQQHSRLATPSFTPGHMDASPLMTWGDIASTPLRIDGEDLLAPGSAGGGTGAGPTFVVPDMPRREMTAHQLAAMKSLTEFKKKQREQRQAQALAAALPPGAGASLAAATPRTGQRLATGGRATPTPQRPGTGGGALSGMSEAALRLAKQLKEKQKRAGSGVRMGTPAGDLDKMLRASYSAAQAGKTPTPAGRGAVSGGSVKPVAAPPAVAAKAAGKSITDDLLHI